MPTKKVIAHIKADVRTLCCCKVARLRDFFTKCSAPDLEISSKFGFLDKMAVNEIVR